ncbi:MAG: 2'-5' RNA ligase family protein [Candidatus Aminicenantes bacterium]|nr:2'-5' RNA ligase family protein [Candidatus Aminicenantes bacterium]
MQDKIFRWRKKYANLPVCWICEKNLHITLIPPFYCRDARAIIEKIKPIKNYSGRIGVVFDRVTFGPDSKRPRLVWAVSKAPTQLVHLKKSLETVLKIPAEKRPFSLHLTLARFKPEDFHRFPIKKLDEKVFWKEEVKSIVLFESKLSPRGAEYEILEEIRLR